MTGILQLTDNPIKKDTIPKFMPESYPIYVGQSKDDVFNSLGIKQIMLDIIKMKQDSVGHYLTGDYSENGLSVHVFQKGDYLSLEFCNKLNFSIITIVFNSGVFSELDFYYDYSL